MAECVDGSDESSSFWKERFSRKPINWPEVRNEIEAGLAKLAEYEVTRDGAGGPYVVLGSETQIAFYGDTLGITCPLMCNWFRRSIVKRGAWRGHGPTALLDERTIERYRSNSQDAIVLAGSTALHELAHFVEWRFRWSELRAGKSSGKSMAKELSSSVADTGELEPVNLRRGHDLQFLRTALHASYRCDHMIYDVLKHGVSDLIDWASIAPSGWMAYCRAMATEFDQLIGVPLSQIRKHPVSDRLAELWNHDGVTLNAV